MKASHDNHWAKNKSLCRENENIVVFSGVIGVLQKYRFATPKLLKFISFSLV